MKSEFCALLALAGTVWAVSSGDGPSTIPATALATSSAGTPPPAPVTAWGEPVDGLQAGLRAPKLVLAPGESVEIELVLRNVGKYPVSFDYLPQTEKGVEIDGLPERGELRLGWGVQGGKPGWSSAYLRQNDEMVRGRVTLTHGAANAIRSGSLIELASGTYRVNLEGNPGDRLNVSPPDRGQGSGPAHGQVQVDFPDLKTGVLELVLPAVAPFTAAPGETQIVLWRDGHPLAITPKGTTPLGTWSEGKRGSIRLGPSGKVLVYVANRMTVRPADPEKRDRVYIRDGKGNTEINAGVSLIHAFWGTDGLVYGSGFELPKWGDPEPPPDLTKDFVNWAFDPRTGQVKALKKLPGNVSVLDRSPDGKAFLVLWYELPPTLVKGAPGAWADYRLGTIPAEGGELVPLTKFGESTPGDFRYSPDRRSILGTMYRNERDRLVPELVVFDLKTKARTAVKVPKGAHVHASCWSPDGKKIAFVWEPEAVYTERMNRFGPVDLAKEKKPAYTVTTANPDGTEARDVYTESEYGYGSIDWGVPPSVQPRVAPGGGDAVRPRQPGGLLGDRLGEYMTIEGVLAEGVKLETGTVLVDTVNGKKLDKPVAIVVRVRGFDATRFDLPVAYVMPAERRVILKGYESGEMIGVPPGVHEAAKELGRKEVPVSPVPWQWRPHFVAYIISGPKAAEK